MTCITFVRLILFFLNSALFKRLFETVGTKQNAKEEQKTIYDMITHLSGHSLPGIPQNSVPPKKMDEATKQYLWQHRLLLLFLKYTSKIIISVSYTHLDVYKRQQMVSFLACK